MSIFNLLKLGVTNYLTARSDSQKRPVQFPLRFLRHILNPIYSHSVFPVLSLDSDQEDV